MKLVEALTVLREAARGPGGISRVALVCGFTPLHVETFLAAHLRVLDPANRFETESGLYDDALGNLDRLEGRGVDAAAVVLEWPDVDPRLGLRALWGWRPAGRADVVRGRPNSRVISRHLTEVFGDTCVLPCFGQVRLLTKDVFRQELPGRQR
jgi:hypothetical protein